MGHFFWNKFLNLGHIFSKNIPKHEYEYIFFRLKQKFGCTETGNSKNVYVFQEKNLKKWMYAFFRQNGH